jgi:hypothetical protein
VTTLGAVGKGLSTGGLATVLAGFVVPSLTTVAVGLAALAALTVVYWGSRGRSTGDRSRRTALATTAGVALAAVLVGVASVWNGLPNAGPFTVGVGVFLVGGLLYVASWEYGRRYLSGGGAPLRTPTG